DWPDKIVYGFIPSEQAETLGDTIQPYMDFLSEQLGIEVEGVVTQDYNGLVVAMGAGQADLGAFGPFGYVQAESLYPGQMEVLMQSVRFGSGTYHGQWFTNDPSICDEPPVPGALEWDGDSIVLKPGNEVVALQVGWTFGDNGLEPEVLDDGTPVDPGMACQASLDKVVGKTIAFTSATSTSGSVFPTLQLINAGIDPENDVSYSYLGSHTDTVAAVYNGDFDIGLSFDDARRNIREDSPDVGSKVIVFNITDEIPNDVVVALTSLPESLRQAVYDATALFLETEDGVALFDEIYGWTDIRPAVDSEFDVVREAAAELGIEND
ncbi:MAG: PhnD/SsuA/transferrin family substrate-binding protein, partial [Acidimicrobiia bacterium]|nr:PhnD/SsuA/transferrin family substrate-binding protein [Acidimicrobiia bacterium]